jgi:hypothetical protein
MGLARWNPKPQPAPKVVGQGSASTPRGKVWTTGGGLGKARPAGKVVKNPKP